MRVVDPAPQAPSPPIIRRRGGGCVSRPLRGRLELPREQAAARASDRGLGCGPMPAPGVRAREHRPGSPTLARGRIRGQTEVERQIVSQPLRSSRSTRGRKPSPAAARRRSRPGSRPAIERTQSARAGLFEQDGPGLIGSGARMPAGGEWCRRRAHSFRALGLEPAALSPRVLLLARPRPSGPDERASFRSRPSIAPSGNDATRCKS
jgi:hypothetical protein